MGNIGTVVIAERVPEMLYGVFRFASESRCSPFRVSSTKELTCICKQLPFGICIAALRLLLTASKKRRHRHGKCMH